MALVVGPPASDASGSEVGMFVLLLGVLLIATCGCLWAMLGLCRWAGRSGMTDDSFVSTHRYAPDVVRTAVFRVSCTLLPAALCTYWLESQLACAGGGVRGCLWVPSGDGGPTHAGRRHHLSVVSVGFPRKIFLVRCDDRRCSARSARGLKGEGA